MENKPWTKGEQMYEDNKWVTKDDIHKLNKNEAQVWLALYNLYMDPQVRNKYDLNDYRKNNLLRLRKYMNEHLFD